jgi:hypothetical protein
MADERFEPQPGLEIPELAFGAATFEMITFQRRHTGGIIAAVFEALERIHQLLGDWTVPENADDAAHAPQILPKQKDSDAIS